MILDSVRLIIFDLDDTLCDTSSTAKDAKIAMVDAMIRAGLPASHDEIDIDDMEILSGKEFMLQVCNGFGCLNPGIVDAGMAAYYGYNSGIRIYPETIDVLKSLPQKKVLLTTGIPEVQQQKVKGMELERYFDLIIYDDIMDPRKETHIRDVLDRYGLSGEEVISVGDKLSDIEASNGAGVISVRKMTGRASGDQVPDDSKRAAFTIKDLRELL